MTRLVARLQSPDIPEKSFAAQPKVIYRAGTRYGRTEESPDLEHGIYGLMIINEPDTWLIKLFTKTGGGDWHACPHFSLLHYSPDSHLETGVPGPFPSSPSDAKRQNV
jgi:hypothetical protein